MSAFTALKRPDGTAQALDVLGLAFMNMEQPEKALNYYQQEIQIRQGLQGSDKYAYALRSMGAALEKMGRIPESLADYEKALELFQRLDIAAEVAGTLFDIGTEAQELHDFDKAAANYKAALEICEQKKYPVEEYKVLYQLGNQAQDRNDQSAALDYHTRALDLAKSFGNQLDVVHSLNRVALVREARGEFTEAEQVHAQALAMFEGLSAQVSDPVQVGAFRETSVILYPHYARVLMELGKTEEAFALADSARGAGLARMESLNANNFTALLTPDERNAWSEATVRVAHASNRLNALGANADSKAEDNARAEYDSAERGLTQLRDRIFAENRAIQSAQKVATPTPRELLAYAKLHPTLCSWNGRSWTIRRRCSFRTRHRAEFGALSCRLAFQRWIVLLESGARRCFAMANVALV